MRWSRQPRSINDRWGRAAGDEGLRLIADTLRTNVRAYDLVGRLGSDAFFVALPGCTAPTAAKRLGQIQATLRKKCGSDERFEDLTFSAGFAWLNGCDFVEEFYTGPKTWVAAPAVPTVSDGEDDAFMLFLEIDLSF